MKPKTSSSPLKKCATAGLSSSAASKPLQNTAGQASSGTQIVDTLLFQRSATCVRPIAVRRGAVLVEAILVLPILLIFLLGVIVFGQALANLQQIALASRVGAEAASETAGLPTTDGDEVPANIITTINQQLGSSGMTACRVTLEHNIVPTGSPSFSTGVTLSSGDCECHTPETSLPPRRGYVRVTVCVRATDVAPNLLCTLGLDFGNKTFEHTTTFRYEF